jgi:hypothetical protein
MMRVGLAKRHNRRFPVRNQLRPQDFVPFLRHLRWRVIDQGKDFEIRIVGDETSTIFAASWFHAAP